MRRRSSTWLLIAVMALVLMVTGISSMAINVATSEPEWPNGLTLIKDYPFAAVLWSTALLALLGFVLWKLQERAGRHVPDPAPPEATTTPGWIVDRPAEVDRLVRALCRPADRAVAITTALHGAGGFGKTTLATLVCADRRIRRQFSNRIYRVTIGRDVRGRAAIATKVNEVARFIAGDGATFDDPTLAGQHLGRLLDRRPRLLLVIDDVWEPDQLAPFLIGGRRCARLVTTRVPSVLPDSVVPVEVDQMSRDQARQLLTFELPAMAPETVERLLAATGRWPLLLRLVNRVLSRAVATGGPAGDAAEDLLRRLRFGGPAAVDSFGTAADPLDLDDPERRRHAVRATFEASMRLLGEGQARLTELGIFAEDESIPLGVVLALWHRTAGLRPVAGRQLCHQMAALSLVSLDPAGGGTIAMHDVLREFLRGELGAARLVGLNVALIDAVSADLPPAAPLAPAVPAPAVSWWELGPQDRYLWDHLVAHLIAAGRTAEAEAVVGDLRWVQARLQRFGPVAPYADLSLVPTGRASALRSTLARAAHLLTPTHPEYAIIDVLHSRVQHDPHWGPQVPALQRCRPNAGLENRWPLPDRADPGVRRTLNVESQLVLSLAIAPDGSWLAAGGERTIRLWDTATGELRATFPGRDEVRALAVAPDGAWLAATEERTVRLWDVATGRGRAVLTGHRGAVGAVAVAPDGTWLVSGGNDATVRVWDVATRRVRHVLTGHRGDVAAVAVAPDGTWLASGSDDHTVRVWDAATGQLRATLTGHTGWVTAVAIAPDGTWLASASNDRTVRIWDASTGQPRATFTGHANWIYGIAIAPDGTWLASAGGDRLVRIWEVATGRARAPLAAHAGAVHAVAIAPDGGWLAFGGSDRTVRICDPSADQEEVYTTAHRGEVRAVAAAPDGRWLASGGDDRTVRLWDVASGEVGIVLEGHGGGVRAVAVAPDGTWVVSGGDDRTVRIWDARGGSRSTLVGHTGWVYAVAIARDGTWLASGGDDRTVRLWDPVTGELRSCLVGHAGWVYALAIAPGGRWFASASNDRTVRIWDVEIERTRLVLSGHTGWVLALAIAPDGTWLASAGDDGTVRIWDVATGLTRATLREDDQEVRGVAITADGCWLAIAGNRGTVGIVSTADWRRVATMRVDCRVSGCAWLPDGSALALTGDRGLFLFDFRHEMVRSAATCR